MSIAAIRTNNAGESWDPKIYTKDELGTQALYEAAIANLSDFEKLLKHVRASLSNMPSSVRPFKEKLTWMTSFRRKIDYSPHNLLLHGPCESDVDFADFYNATGTPKQKAAHRFLVLQTELVAKAVKEFCEDVDNTTVLQSILTLSDVGAVLVFEGIEDYLGLTPPEVLEYAGTLLDEDFSEDLQSSFAVRSTATLNNVQLAFTLTAQAFERRQREVAVEKYFSENNPVIRDPSKFSFKLPIAHYQLQQIETFNNHTITWQERLAIYKIASKQLSKQYKTENKFQGEKDATYAAVTGEAKRTKSEFYDAQKLQPIGFGGYKLEGIVYTSKGNKVICPNIDPSSDKPCKGNHYKNYPKCSAFDQNFQGGAAPAAKKQRQEQKKGGGKARGKGQAICRFGPTCRNQESCRFKHESVHAIDRSQDLAALVTKAVETAMHTQTACPCREHKSAPGTNKGSCERYQAYIGVGSPSSEGL